MVLNILGIGFKCSCHQMLKSQLVASLMNCVQFAKYCVAKSVDKFADWVSRNMFTVMTLINSNNW